MSAAHRLTRAGIALALTLAAAIALTASPALASRGHRYERSFGRAGSGTGEFKEPWDVAVNEATGDIYVVDHGNNRVEIFNEKLQYVGEFDGSGSHGEGKVAGSGGLTNEPKTGQLAEVETGQFDEPTQIAVDNSCHYQNLTGAACEKFDPSNGDVYVLDDGHFVIDKYTASGQYVGQIIESVNGGRFELQLKGVGVAPDGTVEVGALEHGEPVGRRVYFYNNNLHNSMCITCSTQEFIPGNLQSDFLGEGLAVNSQGDTYVQQYNLFAPALVGEYSPTGETLALINEVPSGLAVELPGDDLYLGSGTSVARYSPSGHLLERFGKTGLDGSGVAVAGSLAVTGVAGDVFVPDVGAGVVDVFPPEPPGPPTIEAESVSKVTSDSAQVNGELNPRGAATNYKVEYWTCASFGSCGAGHEGSAPAVEGLTGSDFEVRKLGIAVQGLLPATTYHFRLVAHNETSGEEHSVDGEEGTFTTQPEGGELVLPDGRMWELVSPPDKHGGEIAWIGEESVAEAAAGGGAFTYPSSAPTEVDPAGYSNEVQVFSRRGANGGWFSQDIATPHAAPTGKSIGTGQEYRFFSEDLSQGLVEPFGLFDSLSPSASGQTPYVREDFGSGPGGLCGEDCYRPLVTGCPELGEPCAKPVEELADVSAGTAFSLTGQACEKAKICGPEARAASPDLSAVVLESKVKLTAGGGVGLYEWVDGRLYYAGSGSEAGSNGFSSVNDDGSRVVAGNVGGSVPLRVVDPLTGEEVQADAGEKCGGCESGGGEDPWVAGEGSRVFFRDKRALTSGSDSGTGAEDLYVCEVPAAKVECDLTDLTPKPASGHADVLGIVGASSDGSSVYFVANGALTEGAISGSCRVEVTTEGECNLYVVSRSGSGWGAPRLVAVLSRADYPDWNLKLPVRTSRVSANGEWLAFMSDRSLTGYDNDDAVSGEPDEEVYLYHATGGSSLVCASCNPTGARPDGVEYGKLGPGVSGVEVWPPSQGIAANVPGWTGFALERSQYQSRYLSDEGRLFFNSSDALVPQDVNGTEDVYEYEPTGLGSCEAESSTYSAHAGGCVSLISSGNSSQESAFLDASANGSDVFFLTAARLSSEDYDNSFDVYDAHECSESAPCPSPSPVPPPPCTTADACRAAPAPQPSIFGAPSSATFVGEGNLAATATTTTTSPPPVKAKTKVLTRAQKLAKALKACKRDRGKARRKQCERQARGRYGVVRKAKRGRS